MITHRAVFVRIFTSASTQISSFSFTYCYLFNKTIILDKEKAQLCKAKKIAKLLRITGMKTSRQENIIQIPSGFKRKNIKTIALFFHFLSH